MGTATATVLPDSVVNAGSFTNPGNAYSNNNVYATTSWAAFGVKNMSLGFPLATFDTLIPAGNEPCGFICNAAGFANSGTGVKLAGAFLAVVGAFGTKEFWVHCGDVNAATAYGTSEAIRTVGGDGRVNDGTYNAADGTTISPDTTPDDYPSRQNLIDATQIFVEIMFDTTIQPRNFSLDYFNIGLYYEPVYKTFANNGGTWDDFPDVAGRSGGVWHKKSNPSGANKGLLWVKNNSGVWTKTR